MPNINPVPFPSFTKKPVRQERKERQTARTNRAKINKGILINVNENIQHAINDVEKNGGGIVQLRTGTYKVNYNITLPSNVTLRGDGRQNTIIDFQDNNKNLSIPGVSGATLTSIRIEDLAVTNSAATAALDINYCDDIILDGILLTSNTNASVRIRHSNFITLRDIISDTPGGDGFILETTSDRSLVNISFYSCISQSHGGIGFKFTNGSGQTVGNLYMFACRANLGTGDGYEFAGGFQMDGAIVACLAASNGGKGFDVGAQNLAFLGCVAESNTGDGFENTDLENKFIGCKSEGNGTEWDLQTRTTFIANSFDFSTSIDPSSEVSAATLDSFSDMIGNLGASPKTANEVIRMQNVHGSTIGGGKTVVWADGADQAGGQFEASFTRGDDRVAGMLLSAAADDEWEHVQTEGFTSILQVNGTDDIAVGDELSLHSANAVAGKAQEGDMVFAIALEGYTADDSSGVIDAVLVKKYKKGSGVPTGAIMMWSGTIASIPSGWSLCDGTGSTPDLRDKFIIGAAAGNNPADGGGSHAVTTGAASNGSQVVQESPSPPTNGVPNPSHTHNFTATDVKHYRLAFIMKD